MSAAVKPTSRKRSVRGVKEEATRLHSKLVRTRNPYCEARYFDLVDVECTGVTSDCAHIIGRVFAHTRTDLENAFGLCAQHHRYFTNWPAAWMRFVDESIGRAEYNRLARKAQAGVGIKFDWYDELDRLKQIARDEL